MGRQVESCESRAREGACCARGSIHDTRLCLCSHPPDHCAQGEKKYVPIGTKDGKVKAWVRGGPSTTKVKMPGIGRGNNPGSRVGLGAKVAGLDGTKPLHSKKISEPPEPIEGAEQQVEQGEWPRTTTPLPASAAAVRNPAVRAFLDPTTQVGQAEVPSACAVPLPPVPVAPGLEAQ